MGTKNTLLMTADWLPVAEACRRSGFSRERLMRRLYAGKIAAEMRFGRWCVAAESLDAYLRDHASESSAA